MRLALLALLLSGCTVPYWQTDEVILGVEFDWQSQVDRDAGPVLCDCAGVLGARSLTGARVRFVADADRDCQPARPETGPVGGCWSTLLNDMVVLEPAARLSDTALCHELAHRAQHYSHGQMPNAEDPHHCDRALWDQLGVRQTGECP